MAQEWCLQYGILEEREAQRLYEKYCKRKGKPIVHQSSPMKKAAATTSSSSSQNNQKAGASNTTTTSSSSSSSAKQTTKRRKVVVEDDEDVDMAIDDTGLVESKAWESGGNIPL
jgi:cytoskeletal protein RodZ